MIISKKIRKIVRVKEMEVKKMETRDWKEKPRQEQEKAQNIRELIGKTFIIKSFEEKAGKAVDKTYTYAIVQTDVGTFRTASAVLIKQLCQMREELQNGIGIRVKIVYRKNYLTFDSP